jgi:phosphatidylglycerol:prolipoprotein diacylglycerol transferase
MLPILQIGRVAIQLPGLLSLAGIWFGISAVDKQAARLQLPASAIQNMVLVGLIVGVLGARLGYAARFFPAYAEDPIGLISLQPATLSPEVGALCGLIACWIYGQRNKLAFWQTVDTLAPGLAVFSLSLGLAHLASGDAFGAPTAVPWAIELWGALRHPSQVYEILAAGLVLIAILRAGRETSFPGLIFLIWVVLASFSRLLLEAFRGDSVLILGGFRAAQIAALLTLLLALIVVRRLARKTIVTAPDDPPPSLNDAT